MAPFKFVSDVQLHVEVQSISAGPVSGVLVRHLILLHERSNIECCDPGIAT
jgi:hypothetical protein